MALGLAPTSPFTSDCVNGLGFDEVMVRSDGLVIVQLPAAKILNDHLREGDQSGGSPEDMVPAWVAYILDLEQGARLAGV